MVVKVSNSALQQLKNIHKQGFISQIFVSSGGCSGIKWDIVQIPLSQLKNKDEKINNYLLHREYVRFSFIWILTRS